MGKILNGIVMVILILVLAFCVAKVGGIDAYVVRSGSMEPAIQTGSLCFVNTHTPYDDIKAGDVIAFRIATGDLVTHRAITVTDQGIETKGDNNDTSDGISTGPNQLYWEDHLFYPGSWTGLCPDLAAKGDHPHPDSDLCCEDCGEPFVDSQKGTGRGRKSVNNEINRL